MPGANRSLITIREPAIYYRKQLVLQDIELEICAGERIALLGKSGAGKSTLLKLLYQQLSPQGARVGWIPQQLGLVDNLSAFHNVYIGQLDKHSRLYNLLNLAWPQATQKTAISQLLASFNLEPELFKTVAELSGGQQQRVAIARAIYSQADIILADEPVANLDDTMADRALTAIIQHSKTTVIALHNTRQALQFADRIIGIQNGKILLDEVPSRIDPAQLEPLYEHP